MSYEDISARLKFIGQISENEKVNVHTRKIVTPSLWTSLTRYIHGETRYSTYQFVNYTVSESFAWIELNHPKPGTAETVAQMLADLKSAQLGIKNLQLTYGHDRMLVSQLSTLGQAVENKVKYYQYQYDGEE